MSYLKLYSKKDIERFTRKRVGEAKVGEAVQYVSDFSALNRCSSQYALFGIPEDIGVRANYGNPGTAKAWEAALGSFLNFQNNQFLDAEKVAVLGELDCDTQMEQAKSIFPSDPHYAEKLGELVSQIDHKVSKIVQFIIDADKVPIAIGGGHNNAYGLLSGASMALGMPINCINFDAHTDFRPLEQRHSGNGFSYAFEEGFLDRYFVFGLQKNHTSQHIIDVFAKKERLDYELFENISSGNPGFSEALKRAETFCTTKKFGLELDMDAIAMMGSSAMSPQGFSLSEAQEFVSFFFKNENAAYLHVCEGAPEAGAFPSQVGKALAYIIVSAIASE